MLLHRQMAKLLISTTRTPDSHVAIIITTGMKLLAHLARLLLFAWSHLPRRLNLRWFTGTTTIFVKHSYCEVMKCKLLSKQATMLRTPVFWEIVRREDRAYACTLWKVLVSSSLAKIFFGNNIHLNSKLTHVTLRKWGLASCFEGTVRDICKIMACSEVGTRVLHVYCRCSCKLRKKKKSHQVNSSRCPVLRYEGLPAAFCVGPGVAAQKNKGRAG